MTVSKGDYQVQHILLTAEALEKESLYKLLAKYTDCIYFYPSKRREERRREKEKENRTEQKRRDSLSFFCCFRYSESEHR